MRKTLIVLGDGSYLDPSNPTHRFIFHGLRNLYCCSVCGVTALSTRGWDRREMLIKSPVNNIYDPPISTCKEELVDGILGR